MARPLIIAVTSAGSGIAQSIIDSCRSSDLPLTLIGLDQNQLAYGLYDCDERVVSSPITEPGFLENLLATCEEHEVDLLIPALDPELMLLSSAAARFRAKGTEVLAAPPAFVSLCRDKLAWAREFSSKTGIVLPAYEANEAKAALESGMLELPLIAKPRGGSASSGVAILTKEHELDGLGGEMIVQQHVLPHSGDPNRRLLEEAALAGRHLQLSELSLQHVFSHEGELAARMASLNKLKDGVPIEVCPFDYEVLADTLDPLIDLLIHHGARGPVNLQARLTDEGLRIFECNPRFTGITGTRALFGFNEVDWLVRDWLGIAQSRSRRLQVNPRKLGVRQVGMRLVDLSELPSSKRWLIETQIGGHHEEGSNHVEPHGEQGASSTADPPGDGSSICSPPSKDPLLIGRRPHSGRRGASRQASVAVSGASGWLGRHLLLALLGEQDLGPVRALVRSEAAASELAAWLSSKHGGKSEPAEILVASGRPGGFGLAPADLLFNLASARPPHGNAEIASSLLFQLGLLREAEQVGVSRIINISSHSVYGEGCSRPHQELDALAPTGAYGMMKLAVEQAVRAIDEKNAAARTTSLRLSRLYGLADNMRWGEVPHSFAKKAAVASKIVLVGGEQELDLLHIEDAVSALLFVSRMDYRLWEEAFNVSGGRSVSVREIANLANSAATRLGLPGAMLEIETGGDRRGLTTDPSRLKKLGWSARIDLPTAMESLVREAKASS